MKLLELFCGTKSVSKAIGNRYTEIINLDLEAKFEPTIVKNILDWDYKIYPPGYFHTIWASPPCTEFSCLNNSRPDKIPNLALSDSLVQKTIEIIEYFNPEKFFIENPQSGTLKERSYMETIPFIDIDYCQFGFPYRKRTRFWTCIDGPNKLCPGKNVCNQMIGRRHRHALGNSTYHEYWMEKGKRLEQRYSIPAPLIQWLFNI